MLFPRIAAERRHSRRLVWVKRSLKEHFASKLWTNRHHGVKRNTIWTIIPGLKIVYRGVRLHASRPWDRKFWCTISWTACGTWQGPWCTPE